MPPTVTQAIQMARKSRDKWSEDDVRTNAILTDELLVGGRYDEGGNWVRNDEAAQGTLNYLQAHLDDGKIYFAFMLRTPNRLKDKLKGEDGHAAVQLFVEGAQGARVQVGLDGSGKIKLENFADSYTRDDDKYTITVYRSEINKEKAKKVIAKLTKDVGVGHYYSRFAHSARGTLNCSTWAVEVAREAGFYFPMTYFTGSNPLYLGFTLKKSKWEQTEYKYQPPLNVAAQAPVLAAN